MAASPKEVRSDIAGVLFVASQAAQRLESLRLKAAPWPTVTERLDRAVEDLELQIDKVEQAYALIDDIISP